MIGKSDLHKYIQYIRLPLSRSQSFDLFLKTLIFPSIHPDNFLHQQTLLKKSTIQQQIMQQSQKKMLVESIKSSMVKPQGNGPMSPKPSPQSKKPDSYSSYMNTAIDYAKNHNNLPYLVPQKNSKQSIIYNLDSDDSPKQDQATSSFNGSGKVANDPYDNELMDQIEREIYEGNSGNVEEKYEYQEYNQKENEQEDEERRQVENSRRIVKPTAPKRTPSLKPTNYNEDQDDEEYVMDNRSPVRTPGFNTRNQPIPSKNSQVNGGSNGTAIKSSNIQVAKRTRQSNLIQQQPEEESKIAFEQQNEPISENSQNFIRKRPLPVANVSSKPLIKPSYTPTITPQPAKRLKTSFQQGGVPVNFKINIKLLKSNLRIKKIKECNGNTRDDVQFVCQMENGKLQTLNNTEMVFFYKDQLINYYQNCHFE